MYASFSDHLKTAMDRLPYITADMPGVGGDIKAEPEHFQVEEILPYEPCGEGEHLFIKLRRQGWNTADVGRALGEPFKLKGVDIGWAGRKDKNAVTTQTFSLRLPLAVKTKDVTYLLRNLPFELLDLKRHRNKLKTGHVAANRFRVILTHTAGQHALKTAQTIGEKLNRTGLPNYYGAQRFGTERRNIDRSMEILKRGKVRGKREGFMVSALQSALFNYWLYNRIERKEFNTIILGDMAKKTDTGGMFIVQELQDAMQRFKARQIIYTGPIYGHKMRPAGSRAEEYENELLNKFKLDSGIFKSLRAPGTRRAAILYPDNLSIGEVQDGLAFTFTLPSGAYATILLREFTRERKASVTGSIA